MHRHLAGNQPSRRAVLTHRAKRIIADTASWRAIDNSDLYAAWILTRRPRKNESRGPAGARLDASRNKSNSRLIVSPEAEMSDHQREIYHSENGDRWLLCRDGDGRVFVLHRANVSSGGTLTRIELGDFLRKGNAGPEHQALGRLVGTLVDLPKPE
jgi:hypothetical protein